MSTRESMRSGERPRQAASPPCGALLHSVAVFVHDIPLHEHDVLTCLFDRTRRFSTADELRTSLHVFARQHLERAAERLRPEDALRATFFGNEKVPRDLAALLWR